jgi:hypothetical protein
MDTFSSASSAKVLCTLGNTTPHFGQAADPASRISKLHFGHFTNPPRRQKNRPAGKFPTKAVQILESLPDLIPPSKQFKKITIYP